MLSSAASSSGFRRSSIAPPPAPRDPLAPLAAPRDRAPAGRSIRRCSSAPRPRSMRTATRSAPRDFIGIVDFSKPSSEPRFHVVDLMNGTVESHPRRPRPRIGPGSHGLPRALLERLRLLCDVERHLHDGRLLRRQVRPFDEGPRPRLDEQQRRSARDRHPQRLVCRAGDDLDCTASSAVRKAASRSAARASGR